MMRKYGIVNESADSIRSPTIQVYLQPAFRILRKMSAQNSFCTGTQILPPDVPVLVSGLFLHLCISEGLQEGAPDVCLGLVAAQMTFKA